MQARVVRSTIQMFFFFQNAKPLSKYFVFILFWGHFIFMFDVDIHFLPFHLVGERPFYLPNPDFIWYVMPFPLPFSIILRNVFIYDYDENI